MKLWKFNKWKQINLYILSEMENSSVKVIYWTLDESCTVQLSLLSGGADNETNDDNDDEEEKGTIPKDFEKCLTILSLNEVTTATESSLEILQIYLWIS